MGVVHTKAQTEPLQPIIGLPQAEINYEECNETRAIPLDVPVRVDRIHVDGLSRTKDDVMQNVTQDLFSSKSFRDVLYNAHKARLRLESLSCFRTIAIHIDVSKGPAATPDGVEVTFHVRELKRIVGGVNTEVGNNEGSVVVGLRAPNTFGRGERVFMEYSYGSRRSNNFTVGIIKPFMGKHSPRLTASIFQNISEFPTSGYRELEKGLAVGYDFISKWDFHHALLYKGCSRDQGVINKASSFEVREQSGATLKSALQHILTIDRRDDVIFPSCGLMFQYTTELSGLGGNIGFIKNDAYLQANYSIIDDVVLQGTVSTGFLKGLSNDMKIGMTDMFFLGGPLDLRGFQMRGIGPRSDGNALGGDAYWSAGLHLFTPLPFRPGKGGFGDIFRTHLFVNAGNIGTVKSDDKIVDQLRKNVRVSTGLGVAIRLGQMARVEINYCFPIKQDQADVVHPGVQFGIGVHFS